MTTYSYDWRADDDSLVFETFKTTGAPATITGPVTTNPLYEFNTRVRETVTNYGQVLKTERRGGTSTEYSQTQAAEYDAFDRVQYEIEGTTSTNAKEFQYDLEGRLYQTIKADGTKIQMEFSPDGTSRKEKWISGSSTAKELTYTYDAIGTLIGATDGTSTFASEYSSNKLRNESQTLAPNIQTQSVNTYKDGRINTVTFKVGTKEDSKLAYNWTESGQVRSIRQYGNGVATKNVVYSYDKIGRKTSIKRYTNTTNSNPVVSTTLSYSKADGAKSARLQSINHRGRSASSSATDAVLANYAYEWDASGRLTKETSSKDGQTSYTYDAVSQLTAADYANIPDTNLGYDANGNRNSNGNLPGPMNRQQSDGESDFEYDVNGNMIRRTNKSTGAVIRYTFDGRDRMTDVTFYPSESGQPTKKVHYEYDPLNRRISESTDTNGDGAYEKVEYFVNYGFRSSKGDAGDSVALRLNSAGEVISRYFHGADVDEIVAEENISPTGTSDVIWVLTDIRGSARDLARVTDGTTTIVNHIKYDAFGQKISESDAAITHLYGYTGREYNEVTKLQYNRARYYDPKLGRWINDDPKGFDAGDANLYRYVGNGPTNGTDPSGLERSWCQYMVNWVPGATMLGIYTPADTEDLEQSEALRLRRNREKDADSAHRIGYQATGFDSADPNSTGYHLRRFERDQHVAKIAHDIETSHSNVPAMSARSQESLEEEKRFERVELFKRWRLGLTTPEEDSVVYNLRWEENPWLSFTQEAIGPGGKGEQLLHSVGASVAAVRGQNPISNASGARGFEKLKVDTKPFDVSTRKILIRPAAKRITQDVYIVRKNGKDLGQLDVWEISFFGERVFIEAKDGRDLGKINPKTQKPFADPVVELQNWSNKQILEAGRTKATALRDGVATRGDKRAPVPSMSEIKLAKKIRFEVKADTPEVRAAVEDSLQRLRNEFPQFEFQVRFGAGS